MRSHSRAARQRMAAPEDTAVASPFDKLDTPVLQEILLDLPVDTRARAAAVCPKWRAVLAGSELWQTLDLSNVEETFDEWTPEAVQAAAARAGGQLVYFSVSYNNGLARAVEDVVAANGASLRVLDITYTDIDTADILPRLVAAAPNLDELHVDLFAGEDAWGLIPMLRNVPPYRPLRVHNAELGFEDGDDTEAVRVVAAALAAHQSLDELRLFYLVGLEPAAVSSLLDAAVTCRVSDLQLEDVNLSAGIMPALTRLLQCDSLKYLRITCPDDEDESEAPLDEEAMALLAAGLAGSATLDLLQLDVRLFEYDHYGAVLDALRQLPLLRILHLSGNKAPEARRAAVGRALGALLANDPAPKLRVLNVSRSLRPRRPRTRGAV